MFIDSTYFNIVSRDIPNTAYEDVSSKIDSLIAEHEANYLEAVLGYELFTLFTAGIAVIPTPDAKWTDIRDGKEFTGLDGRLKKWSGLKDSSALKKSPIADLVYYWYLRNNSTQTSGIGELQPEAVNASRTHSRRRQSEAWNRMVEQTVLLIEFLKVNYAIYPEFTDRYISNPKYRAFVTKINPYGF